MKFIIMLRNLGVVVMDDCCIVVKSCWVLFGNFWQFKVYGWEWFDFWVVIFSKIIGKIDWCFFQVCIKVEMVVIFFILFVSNEKDI